MGDEEGGEWLFREAVDSLMWLAMATRPDIWNGVREVARFPHNPSKQYWDVVKWIVKQIWYTRAKNLTLVDRKKGLDLTLYADSDFARDKSDTGVP